jgi:hypothetical protein
VLGRRSCGPAERLDRRLRPIERADVAEADRRHLRAVEWFREERQRRRGQERDHRRQLVRQRPRPIAVHAQQLGRPFERIEERTAEHDRPDRVEPELE